MSWKWQQGQQGPGTKVIVWPLENPDSGTSALQVPTSGVTLLYAGHRGRDAGRQGVGPKLSLKLSDEIKHLSRMNVELFPLKPVNGA